jgi:hypothetical protein
LSTPRAPTGATATKSSRGAAIKDFLRREWARELAYRPMKELWCFTGNRISVRFEYESHDESGRRGGCAIPTTGLQHLPTLRLRVVLDREPSRRSYYSDAEKARATLTLEGNAE